MAKYNADLDKYEKIFDRMFGSGSFDAPVGANAGRAEALAEIAKMEAKRREDEARALAKAIEKAQKEREKMNRSKSSREYYEEQVRRGNMDIDDVPKGARSHVGQERMKSIDQMERGNADVLREVARLGGPQDFGGSPAPEPKKKEKEEDGRDGFFGFLDDTLGRASKSAIDFILPGLIDEQNKVNASRGSENPIMKEQMREADTGLEKGSDILGTLLGGAASAIPALRATKALGLGAKANTVRQLAKEGATVGGLVGLGQAGASEIIQPEERDLADHAKNVALEIGLGAILDPAISKVVGRFGNAIRKRLMSPEQAKRAVEDEVLLLGEGQAQLPPGRTQMVERSQGQPRPDVVSIQGQRVPNTARVKLQQFFDQLNETDLPPGREQEVAEELWTQFAGPQDRSLMETIDLAYPSRPSISSSAIDKARMRTVSGADGLNRSTSTPEEPNFTMMEEQPLSFVGQNQPMNRMQVIKQLEDLAPQRVEQLDDLPTGRVEPMASSNIGIAGNQQPVAGTTDISQGFNYQGSKTPKRDELGESRFGRMWNQAMKQFSDDTVYAKVIENTAKGLKRFKDGSQSLHRGLINSRGATSVAEEMMNDFLLPVFSRVNKAGRSVETGLEYTYARHFKDILKKNPDYKLPEGITREGIESTIKAHQNDPVMESVREGINDLFSRARQMLKDSGRYSKEQIENMEQLYSDYIPLFREKDFESEEAFESAMERFLSSTKPIQSLKGGSDDKIADPIENITRSLQNMVYASMRNKALQNLQDLSGKKLPNGKTVVREVSKPGEGQNAVTVYFNGEPVHYNVQKELFDAIESTKGAIAPEALMKWYEKATTLQRQAITYNPMFAVKSIVRDMPVGWVTSKSGWSVLRDLPQATADLFFPSFMRDKSNLREFYQNGGGMNSIYMQDRKKFREIQNQAYQNRYKKGFIDAFPGGGQTAKVLQFVLRHYQDFLENTEQLPKYTEYLASRRKGIDMDESIFNARDTFDYQKAGRSIRKLNRITAFVNANIRGKEKYARSLAEKPLETLTKTVIAGGIPIGLSVASLDWASEEQRQRIEESPDWMKNTHYLIAIPGSDQVLRIPKAHEVAATVDAVASFFQERNPQETKKMWQDWFMQNIFIDPTLTPAIPALEATLNRDMLTGGDIIGYADQNKRPIEQTDVYTSAVANMVAKAFSLVPLTENTGLASPKRVDHVLKGLVPYSGEQVLTGIDRMVRPEGEEAPDKPNIVGLPGSLEQFLTSPDQRSGYVNDLYNQRQEQRILKGEESSEFDEERYSQLNKLIKANQELSREIREIDNNTELTSKEKREQRADVIDELNALLRSAKESGIVQ